MSEGRLKTVETEKRDAFVNVEPDGRIAIALGPIEGLGVENAEVLMSQKDAMWLSTELSVAVGEARKRETS